MRRIGLAVVLVLGLTLAPLDSEAKQPGNGGCVISPPFPPGYPTCYTAAPRWIARPDAAGTEPASRRNHWTAGT